MGSVKDLMIIKEPEENKSGIARFIFSNRYSVFDWGEMPDHLKEKGKTICLVGAYFFEKLEEYGIKTHYYGLLEDNEVKKLKDLKKPSDIMEIKLLRRLIPKLKNGKYDYSIYKKERGNFLIPLEIIYRNSLPEGSSVFKRLKEKKLKIDDLGLEKMPEPGAILENPIIDFSTKLEKTDRYLSFSEAKETAGLSEDEFLEIKEKTLLINRIITEEVKKIGLFNEDGKLEFGFDENRDLILIDVFGTLDECRFTYENLPISKEVLRIYYKKTDWYKEIEKAKKIDAFKWKEYIKEKPQKLPQELKRLVEEIYCSYANEITNKKWFSVPSLKEVIKNLKDYLTTLP